MRRQPGEPPEHCWDEHGHTGNAASTLGLANSRQQTILLTAQGKGFTPARYVTPGDISSIPSTSYASVSCRRPLFR